MYPNDIALTASTLEGLRRDPDRQAHIQALAALPRPDGLAVHELGLADIGKRAAEVISTRGWTQGTMAQPDGQVCLHGALQVAARERDPRDYELVSLLYSMRGSTMSWNDDTERTREEVIAALEAEPLTDAEITEALGPQWPEMILLNRATASVVPQSIQDPIRLSRWDGHAAATLYAPTVDIDLVPRPRVGFEALGSMLVRLTALGLAAGVNLSGPIITGPIRRSWVTDADADARAVFMRLNGLARITRDNLARTAGMLGTALAALSLRDRLVTSQQGHYLYETLTAPVAAIIGPLHREDRLDPMHPAELSERVATVIGSPVWQRAAYLVKLHDPWVTRGGAASSATATLVNSGANLSMVQALYGG